MHLKGIVSRVRQRFRRTPRQASSPTKGVEMFTNATIDDVVDTIGLRGHDVALRAQGPYSRVTLKRYHQLGVTKELPLSKSQRVVGVMLIDGHEFFLFEPVLKQA